MRGSRIQSVVRELNNEKIDIVNYTEKSEVFITRALSPAKPVDLYIDDDRKYCVAIFDEGGLENAVGRSGVNINLASKLTGYTIDAYTKKEYEDVLLNQKTNLDTFKGIKKGVLKKLASKDIVSVADYLGAKKFILVDELELSPDEIDSISSVVNEFISKNNESEEEEKETPAEDVVEAIVEAIEKETPAEEEVVEEAPAEEETPAEEEVVEEAPAEEETPAEEEVVEEAPAEEETPAEEEVEEEK
jgi:N utilization substance protein A